ncbi:MAG: tryptophan-rich sensory protein [Rhodobacteraceae bacterium]|jgi:tryptophan-rich sensory protein|nr:tryptophan-rich sensory protein [Paracoccaceae bacterium]
MDYTLFFTYLVACGAAAATGAMFMPGAWYRSLNKPVWTPPDWLFPLAWTTLYLCMSLAAMRVAQLPGTGLALALWSVQIAFNTLWTPVFFGLRRLGAGLVVLGCLWLAVTATMLAFWGHDRVAGLLFAPYLLWVTVAGALNFSVWRLNRTS